MKQEIFRRVEEKYLLSRAQYATLMRMLEGRLLPEAHGNYAIRNIYFDTPDFSLIRRSIDATVYKEKLRLRSYGRAGEDDTVFLELKKKFKGVVYKRRTGMRYGEAMRYLAGAGAAGAGSQILREIDYFRGMYEPLVPRVFLAYERAAYTAVGDPDLRLTFDENIRARLDRVALDGSDAGERILKPGEVVMEIKIPGAMPLWLNHILTGLHIFARGFSKYGIYYESVGQSGLYRERTEKLHA